MIDENSVRDRLDTSHVPRKWYWISNVGYYKPGYVNFVYDGSKYHVILLDGRKPEIDKKFVDYTKAAGYFIQVMLDQL